MLLSDYDFELAEDRIAQEPAPRRDGSRLMVLPLADQRCLHYSIKELPSLLREGDLLVFNDTKVIPARMLGHKQKTGGKVEVLLLELIEDGARGCSWRAMAGSSKPFRVGAELVLGGLIARVEGVEGGGVLRLVFDLPSEGLLVALREGAGRLPLPPYLDRPDGVHSSDLERYQTIYAKVEGAVAAPTAGLHFTPELFASLDGAGVQRAFVTLHVGPGTFLPVRTENLEDHEMHEEEFFVSEETARAVAEAKSKGQRVICVGTTSLRALESSLDEAGQLRAGHGRTRLFVRPGTTLSVADGLLTNFHLPRSTLLMLVASLTGRERLLAAYAEAIAQDYRFFSYGDAMLVL